MISGQGSFPARLQMTSSELSALAFFVVLTAGFSVSRKVPSVSSIRLLVDAGNSRVKFGLFDGTREPSGLPKCISATAIDVAVSRALGHRSARGYVSDRLNSATPSFCRGFESRGNRSPPGGLAEGSGEIRRRIGYSPEFPLEIDLPEPAEGGD